ncbi:MYND-type domain-containing protein [Mycena venus]|uniref:MYND-type domain-containing protein n=1 Tax=Mycena venus TaxID=2733690 RepID=A0A8H6YBX0_9AGAR|nr:MYND-type domain-containing protein [Mycena venus]
MHPALKFGNVEKLPISLRRHAIPAYNGSLEHLERLVESLRSNPDYRSSLVIPVFYANLVLPRTAPGPEPTMIGEEILRASVSIHGIVLLPNFPERVLFEIWPRFWHWFQHIYQCRRFLQTPSEKQMLSNLMLFLELLYNNNGHSFDLAYNEPGLCYYVARAWILYLPGNRLDYDDGFRALTLFLRLARSEDGSQNRLEKLEEFIDGAGGTSALASLVIRHMEFFSHAHGDEGAVRFLYSAIAFLRAFDSDYGPFRLELLSLGVLKAVVEALAAIHAVAGTPNGVFTCIWLLGSMLNTRPIYPWIKQAVAAGFLSLFLRCSIGRDANRHGRNLAEFVEFLASTTMYRPVLRPLHEAVDDLKDLMASDGFQQSVICEQWARFVKLIRSRFTLMTQLDSSQAVTRKACDNIECGVTVRVTANVVIGITVATARNVSAYGLLVVATHGHGL